MADKLQEWIKNIPGHPACLACVLCLPGQPPLVHCWSPSLKVPALEHTARSVMDVIRVLQLHRLPSQHLKWTFKGGVLHLLSRPDERALLVVGRRDTRLPVDYLDRLSRAFAELADARSSVDEGSAAIAH